MFYNLLLLGHALLINLKYHRMREGKLISRVTSVPQEIFVIMFADITKHFSHKTDEISTLHPI